MFGALALYSSGVIFSVMTKDGTIRLKGVGDMIDRFNDLGMEKWIYESSGQMQSGMPYWTLPDSALDDPEEASALAREALTHLV